MLSAIRRSAFVGDIVRLSPSSDTGVSQANLGGGVIIGKKRQHDNQIIQSLCQ